MPTVTALKPQKNNKRINVYLDGKFSFGIDLDNLVKFGIKIEKNYTEAEIEKIIQEAEFQKTFEKLLRFSTFRPRSKREVTDWFKRKKVHESMHEKLLQRLTKLDLLDDERFALWWVEQRLAFRQKSQRALKVELINKGIAADIIEEVLAQNPVNEAALAQKLIDAKSARWSNMNPRERSNKMTQFLLRKGFSWAIIKELIQGGDPEID